MSNVSSSIVPTARGLRMLAGLALCTAIAAPAWAQSQKPGLWEVRTKMGGNPEIDRAQAEMQKALAGLSPQQRKQMEAMMGAHGVGLGTGADGGIVTRICISKEMAEQKVPPVQTEGHCTTTVTERSANRMKARFTCTNPPSNGEGEWTFRGDSGYTMKMTTTTVHNGKPQTATMEGQGRWVSADCGKIAPLPTGAGKR
ncbi:MAG: DUF3617 domain-containing protein [Tibeticola sp.]